MRRPTSCGAAILFCSIIAGCRCTTSFDPWAYVYCKGGPRQITAWAARQTDWKSISDSLSALATIAHESDRAESEAAAGGFVSIYERIVAGWPDLEVSGDSTLSANDEREALINECFQIVAGQLSGREGNHGLVSLYYRIAPPRSNLSRYRAWQMAAAGRLVAPARKPNAVE